MGLGWVKDTAVAREGDPAKDAMFNNHGWHLLHVTGGRHGPVEYVFGWGDPDDRQEEPMTEHATESKPLTRIYWRESDALPDDVEWTDRPPTGPLDGWHAADVDEPTWKAYTSARQNHERAVRQAEEASKRREQATTELWREAGVGRALGRAL